MISIYKNINLKSTIDGEVSSFELRGLSTDEKPTEINNKMIGNGSVFIEIDTGNVFLYNEETQEWNEV